MINRTNTCVFAFFKSKPGTFNLPLKNPFSCFIHSDSNHGNGPVRSIYQKVTNLDDALKLFDEMSHRRPLPSVVKFTQLLNSVTKMKHFSTSLDIFKQMCSLGVPIDEYSMSSAIKCCCQLHRTNDGFALLGNCFRRSIVPNVFIFSTLLDGLVIEGRILDAERLFKKLIKHKLCEPDVVMYSTMIKGLCKIGNNVTAIALLRLMDERGCNPNLVVYCTIIYGLCKNKMIDDAFKLFKEMVFCKRIIPDVITYTSLNKLFRKRVFCNRHCVSNMLTDMEEDVQTYSVLVDSLCKEGKVKEAEGVINIMIKRGKDPEIVTYNSLIDGYCLQGEMIKARETFESLTFRSIVPNVVTYNSLLNGYCKSSNIEEAMHMFKDMSKQGLKPNLITYNTMLQGLFRAGRYGAACKLFNEMHSQGPVPNEVTYGIILEGLCNNHLIEDAQSLFRVMCNSKRKWNVVVYNALIDGARRSGKLDIARTLFQDLTAKGLQPNVQTFNLMIGAFCHEGLHKDAKELFLKMNESGCPPDNVTYRVLLYGYLKNQHYDDLEMLLHEMVGRGFSLDALTLSMYIDQIAVGSLKNSFPELISKLVPKAVMDNPNFSAQMVFLKGN